MTNQQINEAIATECGWTYYDGWHDVKGREGLPDYCNDLNAMHEAEKILFTTNNWDACTYETTLQKETTSWAWHSTAKQRAEAFLKTIGKWEE